MFIGFYRLDDEEYFDIYYKNSLGYDLWNKNTFSPNCKDIAVLDFKISGNNYIERQSNLIEIAKDWQNNFAGLEWSYGEYACVSDWFYKNAKRYGLIKEFKENCII